MKNKSAAKPRQDAGTNSLNTLKRKNRREVLELVRFASPISIADIAARTTLSKVTITKILDHYRDMGLVDAAKADAGEERGKRPQIFTVNPSYRYMYCVIIDGYTMLATLADVTGKIFASHTAIYDQRIELAQMIKSVADAFHMLVQREGRKVEQCLALVAGLHGIIDPDSGVCFLSPQFPGWGKDIPLKNMLKDLLPPGIPIHLDNGVHFYGRGEVSIAPASVTRLMSISSEIEGINGALMVDGKLYRGHNCLAGEIGHMIVDTNPDAEICQCGGKGCFEASVSPRRMAERLGAKSFDDVLAAAGAGEKDAWAELAGAARHFAVAIRNIMQLCDPEAVIIHGEYAKAGDRFLEEIRTQLGRTSLVNLDKTVELSYSRLGQYGAIIGAANFALDIFFENV